MRKSVVILTLLVSIMLISGCSKKESTISIFATGTVLVQPDIMQMNITLSNVSRTTQIASQAVNLMVRQALNILKEAGIEEKNIATTSLNYRSEYEWTHRRILVGQRAEQSITFLIEDIQNQSDKASDIIDKLIQINGIELNSINFSVKNNAEYFEKSRELAFQKGMEKATQYAKLSNMKICKVLSIDEEGMQYISPIQNRYNNRSVVTEALMDESYGKSMIPSGEQEITTKIIMVFLMK